MLLPLLCGGRYRTRTYDLSHVNLMTPKGNYMLESKIVLEIYESSLSTDFITIVSCKCV